MDPTPDERTTHQLGFQVQHASIYFLFPTLRLQVVQDTRRLLFTVESVQRVRARECPVRPLVLRSALACRDRKGSGRLRQGQRSGILVRLEEEEELRLQGIAVFRIESQDCKTPS